MSSIEEAGPGDITFLGHPRYRRHLSSCKASAVIAADESAIPPTLNSLRVDDPYRAFARIHGLFNPPVVHPAGIGSLAVVDPTAVIGADAALYPHCYVGKNARVGERTVLMSGVAIGAGAQLGKGCVLHPNVTVADRCRIGDGVILHAGVVIGSDGFGYVGDGRQRLKVPQAGIVELADDVEIGANTTVDRATIGSTRIGAGTKIDNLVQIGHNVVIGERCLIVAQTGIGGSTVVGDDVVLAGQAGIKDHLEIGQGSVIGPKSTVLQSVFARVGAVGCGHGGSSQAVAQGDAAVAQAARAVAAGFRDRAKHPHVAGGLVWCLTNTVMKMRGDFGRRQGAMTSRGDLRSPQGGHHARKSNAADGQKDPQIR